MSNPIQADAAKQSEHARLLWLTEKVELELLVMLRSIGQGLDAGVAAQTVLAMLDRHYRRACTTEGIEPQNHMMNPSGIELQARFALDALFGSLKGSPDEAEARKAFWSVLRRATLPSLSR